MYPVNARVAIIPVSPVRILTAIAVYRATLIRIGIYRMGIVLVWLATMIISLLFVLLAPIPVEHAPTVLTASLALLIQTECCNLIAAALARVVTMIVFSPLASSAVINVLPVLPLRNARAATPQLYAHGILLLWFVLAIITTMMMDYTLLASLAIIHA